MSTKTMIRLVYFGQEFYHNSGTILSSIYRDNEHGSLERYDYGFLQRDLSEGHEVKIRQATEHELAVMRAKLEQMRKR